MLEKPYSLVFLYALVAIAAADAQDRPNEASENTSQLGIEKDAPVSAEIASLRRESVARGKYMVELLGCGSCHTNGAIVGRPDPSDVLSGSDIGIAFTTPLLYRDPGVVYVPNITPDDETGIGLWSREQIVNAVRAGQNLHGLRQGKIMPWEGYSILTDQDAYAIADYLQSIPAVKHRVPENVSEGDKATEPYIYLGVYEQE